MGESQYYGPYYEEDLFEIENDEKPQNTYAKKYRFNFMKDNHGVIYYCDGDHNRHHRNKICIYYKWDASKYEEKYEPWKGWWEVK